MKYHDPLKKILSQVRSCWDRNETRAVVRRSFREVLHCRPAQLDAEVCSSENQEFIVHHTCKSSACPSSGYRSNLQTARAWAAFLKRS
jgi:hypothetical protein